MDDRFLTANTRPNARGFSRDTTLEIRRPLDQSAQMSEGSKDRYLVIALLGNMLVGLKGSDG